MLCVRFSLAVLTLQTFCIRNVLALNKKSLYKTVEDDVEKLKASKVKCSKADSNNVLRLKCEGHLDKATVCIGEKLLVKGRSDASRLWTLLGDIYNRLGKNTKANKCFKEAAKLSGKFTGQIGLWHIIAPFQIGKPEIDGDPLEAFGGIEKLSCQKHNKDFEAYSELVPGGKVTWETVQANENGIVAVSYNLEGVASQLVSVASYEWQGWFVGDFLLNSEMTLLIQCERVSTIYINGNILAGDLYNRSQYWHPVHLKPGMHSVLLRARAVGVMRFSCLLTPADKEPSLEIHPLAVPDLVDGRIFSNHLSIPISNHHPTKWLTITKLSVVSQSRGPDISLHLDKQQRLTIAPGQIHSIIATFTFKDNDLASCPGKDTQVELQLKSNDGLKYQRSFEIRCRGSSGSFVFTFIDHDGSLQKAAAIFPIIKKETGALQTYPVLLTLHGSGILAQDQADAYKRRINEKWLFGVEGMWTLAPTRHGAHNWEGPGELTAMTSLEKLAELTRGHDWINAKANSKAVVFAGHSMGGHGAWQLSTHRPDIALAVLSIAGWTSKESYGESNVFFRHDISISHTDPSVKHIMESCIAENDADKHSSNLKGVPVMIRVGEKDNVVPSYFSKRMYRLLKEQGNDVTYNEIPRQGHWWWDTYTTNDGGVVNDQDIRKFLLKHSKFAIERISSPACSKNKDKTSCEKDDSTSKYSSTKIPNRNIAASGEFLLTVYNPSGSHGVRGVQVIQQSIPFRKTTVRIKFTESNVTIVTTNAIRLRFTEPSISPVLWAETRLIVDGLGVSLDDKNEKIFDLCKNEAKNWKLCEAGDVSFESETQRGPLNHGPSRRVAERPLVIVVDASSKRETTQALLQMAVYIANTFYLTSDSIVPVIRNTDLDDEAIRDHNLIIVGEISFTKSYLEKVPLNFKEDQSVSLGNCVFESRDIGVLSLVPHSGSRLALVITGTSLSSIRDVMHLATPTIPPMARSPFSNLVPDYVLTGPDFKAQGPGGYLCAGFWGNHWEYRSDTSSCSC